MDVGETRTLAMANNSTGQAMTESDSREEKRKSDHRDEPVSTRYKFQALNDALRAVSEPGEESAHTRVSAPSLRQFTTDGFKKDATHHH